MNYAEVVHALRQASGFDLYRLQAAIARMLTDPKWILAIRRELHLGQQVEYFDVTDNCPRMAQILEFRKKEVLLRRLDNNQHWLVHYAALNLAGADARIRDNPERGLSRQEVAIGDVVGFHDHDQQLRSGEVIRLNTKTVTLRSRDQQWRVAYALLHRVVDVAPEDSIPPQTIKP